MIQSNELRIGNLIFDENKFHKIEWHNLGLPELPYEPVPLASDILEKCWFNLKNNRYQYHYSDDKTFYLYQTEQGWRVEFPNPETHLTYLRYLHELQNLFFALRCVELDTSALTSVPSSSHLHNS